MLTSLLLNNVALIKKQSIEFSEGFNCLLGQSGAGKSIIIDALAFALGAKADKSFVRSGQSQMRVDAVFSNLSNDVLEFLKEQEIECDDELIVTRTLSVDGKSSIKLNGFPIPAKILQNLAEKMVDFCGQHDSVGLLNVQNHLTILDEFCGDEITALKLDVEKKLDQVREIEGKIQSFGGSEEQREREKELLKYQIEELEDANLQLCEDDELKERFAFLSSAEMVFEKLSETTEKLENGRENAVSLVYESKSALSPISNFKNISECQTRLENCYYELKDIAETLNDIKSETEFDPKELERIDERLELIKKLSRKYGKTIEDMLNFLEESKQKLENLENSEEMLAKLESELESAKKSLLDACESLSKFRQAGANRFENLMMKELEDLEMKGTRFKVTFEKCDPTRKGFDAVKFMFSANQGQELRDLHKTASGGELSRLLLAFKNIMLGRENVQSVVFDEIDSGISGHTAGRLAEKLSNISKYTQVICITHTPVVAARANAFLLVEKSVIDGETISTARSLNNDEAIFEVARLIDGGKDVSQTAIEHAKKLFE